MDSCCKFYFENQWPLGTYEQIPIQFWPYVFYNENRLYWQLASIKKSLIKNSNMETVPRETKDDLVEPQIGPIETNDDLLKPQICPSLELTDDSSESNKSYKNKEKKQHKIKQLKSPKSKRFRYVSKGKKCQMKFITAMIFFFKLRTLSNVFFICLG